ncbi:CTPA1 [Auxenochlorella protothecoides x Auxenochlorella symbiontica]
MHPCVVPGPASPIPRCTYAHAQALWWVRSRFQKHVACARKPGILLDHCQTISKRDKSSGQILLSSVHRALQRGMLGIAGLASVILLSGASPAHAVNKNQLLYLEAWKAVDRAYVDKTFNGQNWYKIRESLLQSESFGDREQAYAAIRKLLGTLGDPFTRHLGPDQYEALKRASSGQLSGIGVEVGLRSDPGSATGRAEVLSVVPGGPADRAGVAAGDTIMSIDGRETGGLSLYSIGALLQGETGSGVEAEVQTSRGRRVLSLQRERLVVTPVQYQACGGERGVAYLRIAAFNQQTGKQSGEALTKLAAGSPSLLVMDLRNNGGGVFAQGVAVAQQLLAEGTEVVLIADSEGVRERYEAEGGAMLDEKVPLIVLVNSRTASAAEVLAGAVQDSGRGRLAGARTFGKGVVQTLTPLSDGSALAVTVARYQTPAGRDINRVGIAPDVEADLDGVPDNAAGFCALARAGKLPGALLDGMSRGGGATPALAQLPR